MNVLLSHSVVHYYLLIFDGSSLILYCTNITYDFIFVTFGCYLYLIVPLSHWTITISHMTALLSHSVVPFFFYSHRMVPLSHWAVPISHIVVFLLYLIVPLFLLTTDGSNVTYSRIFITFNNSIIFTHIE